MYVNNLSEITSAYIGAKQTVQNANTPNSSSSPNSSEDKENGVSLTISSEATTPQDSEAPVSETENETIT